MQDAINIFKNLYYDYWDIITKFRSGSMKWNTLFSGIQFIIFFRDFVHAVYTGVLSNDINVMQNVFLVAHLLGVRYLGNMSVLIIYLIIYINFPNLKTSQ